MKKTKIIAYFLLVIFILGCRPPGFEIGGGHSGHTPPDEITFGTPTKLELKLSVWGEGSRRMSKRWTKVTCYYKLDIENVFHHIPMTIAKEEKDRINFECYLPAVTDKNAKTVIYYFDLLFDDHYNKHEVNPIPVKNG